MNHRDNHSAKRGQYFRPTNWAVTNTTATYFLTILLVIYGGYVFLTLPKEQFPDVLVPQIYVTTIYAGNSPKDIENLVTRPLEKAINVIGSAARIKSFTSNSYQDFSLIRVEFQTDVDISVAREKIKDAIEKARADLPEDLTEKPTIRDVNVSDIPVMFVNVSGPGAVYDLKQQAEALKDQLETINEVARIEMVGAPEKIIQVHIDKYKLEYAQLSMRDVENALHRENMNIGVGKMDTKGMRRSLYVNGEFTAVSDMASIRIVNLQGSAVYLSDIADIQEGFADVNSYARLNAKPVITLNVIKKAGENLIAASEKIHRIVADYTPTHTGTTITITGDLSKQTQSSFNELINSIVFGFSLVLLILMFFMGSATAFFVALSVPLSICMTFLAIPLGDLIVGTSITLNFIVLFALLFGLGIIVDDAIVVIENSHRIFHMQQMSAARAVQYAAGEVFVPVLSGTVTTLVPFFPLLFWKGLIGKFMIYLPVILIFTLVSSLVVAFLMNPVFALSSLRKHAYMHASDKRRFFRQPWLWMGVTVATTLDLCGFTFYGNFLFLLLGFLVVNCLFFHNWIYTFQFKILPNLSARYERLLRFSLKGLRPVWFLVAMFVLFGLSVCWVAVRVPANKIFFFPRNENPNKMFVYIKLPAGASVLHTDSITREVEKRVFATFADRPSLVESVVANVAAGPVTPDQTENMSVQPNKAVVQVFFVEPRHRPVPSGTYLSKLRDTMATITGANISVQAEKIGPPAGADLNIEVTGEHFDTIAGVAKRLQKFLRGFPGIDEPTLDIDLAAPEVRLDIDRTKANQIGLTTAQIGSELRAAVLGKEATKFKAAEKTFPVVIRFRPEQRENIQDVLNTYTAFRSNAGVPVLAPFSSFVKAHYTHTYSVIKRKQLKRTISVYANVASGYSPTSVNQSVEKALAGFGLPQDVKLSFTGEKKEQDETTQFLLIALLSALLIMLAILVIQFNSLSRPIIVMCEIFFSLIGVLIGFSITKMEVPTIMVGVGMVGLSGIVVKNAILIIEFADKLRERGMRVRQAVIAAGKARIIPVLLTTLATTLGLVPLAVGLNIDFYSWLTTGNARIFFGGDSVVFWGPLSWTIIFGLVFAFSLTLVLVPAMYLLAFRLKRPLTRFYGTKWIGVFGILGPVFFVLVFFAWVGRTIRGKKLFAACLNGPPHHGH